MKGVEVMRYNSCYFLEHFYLFIDGNIEKGGNVLRPCCELISNFPGAVLCSSAEESLSNFLRVRADIISESVKFALLGEGVYDDERKHTETCSKCGRYQSANWGLGGDGLIRFVAVGLYPAPCQCKCIHCVLRANGDTVMPTTDKAKEMYEYAFNVY